MPLIIITDDEPMNIRMTEFVLRKYGYSTVSAGSGEKCVVLAEKGADLILMDVLMPGMDGLQTYEKLRSCGIEIPVVFLTSAEDAETVEKIRSTTQQAIPTGTAPVGGASGSCRVNMTFVARESRVDPRAFCW